MNFNRVYDVVTLISSAVVGVIKEVSGNVRAFINVHHINPLRNTNENHKLHQTRCGTREERYLYNTTFIREIIRISRYISSYGNN